MTAQRKPVIPEIEILPAILDDLAAYCIDEDALCRHSKWAQSCRVIVRGRGFTVDIEVDIRMSNLRWLGHERT